MPVLLYLIRSVIFFPNFTQVPIYDINHLANIKCSNPITETLEKCVKCVQSNQQRYQNDVIEVSIVDFGQLNVCWLTVN